MTWMYWVSGGIALGLLAYLMMALLKPRILMMSRILEIRNRRGIAGMDRMIQANVIAMSGRAVEAAGDVDVLLLDKTGTITLCNRQAVSFVPSDGTTERELADAAQISSRADETPEGRSVVVPFPFG